MSVTNPTIEAAHIGKISATQVAMIGLISALISATIGIPVAYISTQSALKTTQVQITGETDRSKSEFLRSQRRDAYAKLLQNSEPFHAAWRDFAKMRSDNHLGGILINSKALRVVDEDLDGIRQNFRTNAAVVYILAAPQTLKRSEALVATVNDATDYVDAYYAFISHSLTEAQPGAFEKLDSEIPSAMNHFEDYVNAFITCARVDMDASPGPSGVKC
jgi:hypothetical protein